MRTAHILIRPVRRARIIEVDGRGLYAEVYAEIQFLNGNVTRVISRRVAQYAVRRG